MRILYIGQYSQGTTSRLRAECLSNILESDDFDVIDTHIPFFKSPRLFRSIGFRFFRGPLIWKINNFIRKKLIRGYDVIWVDKATFIQKSTTKALKKSTKTLIHYTPDTMFYENQSFHFYRSLKYYDYAITTKSFDWEGYKNYLEDKQMLFVPQGYSTELHYPRTTFQDKKNHVLFIGLYEQHREDMLNFLLKNGINVVLAGKNWKHFVENNSNPGLTYLGEGLFKDEYATTISRSLFGLGLVSKRFPELHTTRTFEIPACGTALITERNKETTTYYDENEVLFFSTKEELLEKVKYYQKNIQELELLTQRGTRKVNVEGYNYQSQLKWICKECGLIT